MVCLSTWDVRNLRSKPWFRLVLKPFYSAKLNWVAIDNQIVFIKSCIYFTLFFYGRIFGITEVPGARRRIGDAAAGLRHSHSHTKSKPHMWPILAASIAHWATSRMELSSSKRQCQVLNPQEPASGSATVGTPKAVLSLSLFVAF